MDYVRRKKRNKVLKVFSCSLILLLTILLFYGCVESFDNKFATYIERTCSLAELEEGCLVNLKSITDFDWDSVYIFSGLMTSSEINQILGFDSHSKLLQDNYKRIVFVKGKTVVFQSQYYGLDENVQFRGHEKKASSFIQFSNDSAMFFAVKRRRALQNGFFFDLFPYSRRLEHSPDSVDLKQEDH